MTKHSEININKYILIIKLFVNDFIATSVVTRKYIKLFRLGQVKFTQKSS